MSTPGTGQRYPQASVADTAALAARLAVDVDFDDDHSLGELVQHVSVEAMSLFITADSPYGVAGGRLTFIHEGRPQEKDLDDATPADFSAAADLAAAKCVRLFDEALRWRAIYDSCAERGYQL